MKEIRPNVIFISLAAESGRGLRGMPRGDACIILTYIRIAGWNKLDVVSDVESGKKVRSAAIISVIITATSHLIINLILLSAA